MRLLLDTHAFVWMALAPERLSARAAAAVSDRENEILLSAASIYEIEFKRDRDPGLRNLPHDLVAAATDQDLRWLSISPLHARAAGRLPRLHGDPFDRVLIAQAVQEGAQLVTLDGRIAAYDVPILW